MSEGDRARERVVDKLEDNDSNVAEERERERGGEKERERGGRERECEM